MAKASYKDLISGSVIGTLLVLGLGIRVGGLNLNLALIDDVGVEEYSCADFLITECDESESARFLGFLENKKSKCLEN